MLKQRLGQRLVQKLSPQQIQLMKLLQVPTAALEQRIKEELEINPSLDDGRYEDKDNPDEDDSSYETQVENIDLSDYIGDEGQDVASYKLKTNHYQASSDDNKTIPIPVVDTFHEYLETQLTMVTFDERKQIIAKHLIGNIDDDGYLRREPEAIVDDLAFTQNIEADKEEIGGVLKIIQSFEPAGVAARSLQECLLIQISRKHKDFTPALEVAEDILENHFDEFSKKHYDKLSKQLSINEEQLKAAINEVLKLNPKPGSGYAGDSKVENYIIPDFIINVDNGELKLTLNSKNAPDLRVSSNYIDMMREYNKDKKKSKSKKEAILFIKQKIDSAKWFIDAIRQRQQTMYNTMNAILDYQYAYFLTGDETKLKPMILKDIAEITFLDISTISRVANSKYVQTEFGTFQLKSFFSESIQTETGEEVSTREVKKILSNLIDDENKRKPLSDQKLTEGLVNKGYNIARRTVAKYREQLNIPVARLRKEL
ncbi:UNVERIFIED_CONTAM: hypothetical protein GTU68_024252 [Idotea baltica]|nr:hypothetical protein [Idotea baltica]